jgi:hypothetical protein
LIHHTLALEKGMLEGLFVEEFIGDVRQSWQVHQQDRTTSGTELPATFEDDALRSGHFSVSPMRFVVEVNGHLERV